MWGYTSAIARCENGSFFLFPHAADWDPADWIQFSYICSNRKCGRDSGVEEDWRRHTSQLGVRGLFPCRTIIGNPNASMIGWWHITHEKEVAL
jgi:hypothetical protein